MCLHSSHWRTVCKLAQKGDVDEASGSVGGTPTGATSSFAKATEDRGTVALPQKLPMSRVKIVESDNQAAREAARSTLR
jgi:hypothetical protein